MTSLTKSEIVQLRSLCLGRIRAVESELKLLVPGPNTALQRASAKTELEKVKRLDAKLGEIAAQGVR